MGGRRVVPDQEPVQSEFSTGRETILYSRIARGRPTFHYCSTMDTPTFQWSKWLAKIIHYRLIRRRIRRKVINSRIKKSNKNKETLKSPLRMDWIWKWPDEERIRLYIYPWITSIVPSSRHQPHRIRFHRNCPLRGRFKGTVGIIRLEIK